MSEDLANFGIDGRSDGGWGAEIGIRCIVGPECFWHATRRSRARRVEKGRIAFVPRVRLQVPVIPEVVSSNWVCPKGSTKRRSSTLILFGLPANSYRITLASSIGLVSILHRFEILRSRLSLTSFWHQVSLVVMIAHPGLTATITSHTFILILFINSHAHVVPGRTVSPAHWDNVTGCV